jgi:hypothetical protein
VLTAAMARAHARAPAAALACLLTVATAHAAQRPCGAPDARAAIEKDADAPDANPGAADAPRVLSGPGFALLVAASGLAALACAPPPIAVAALSRAVLAAEDELATDAELAIVLSTHALGCSNIYYEPLANDTRGIGYAHIDPRELFDLTPLHQLEGIAFLNDWPYWQSHAGELQSAFDHELGHRWGARVHANVRGVPSAALLGREQSHWSYYFDTGGSPLEGNVWRDHPPGYTSETPLYPDRFSPFDLYAMGVEPPDRVPPARLLLEPLPSGADCRGMEPSAVSPPQTCAPLELAAEPVSVSIDDVIAVEGPRQPSAEPEPRAVRVLVLMLHSSNIPWSADDCQAAALALRERVDGFERATSGLLRLENVLEGDRTCDDLALDSSDPQAMGSRRPQPSAGGSSGCALSADRGYRRAVSSRALLAIACAASWWGRRVRGRRRRDGVAARYQPRLLR